MANNSPTLVMASLSDDQLKKSIDSLVSHVDEAMKKMVQSTNNAVGEMEAKLKSLGNLKIDSEGTNDGGTGRRTQQHEKFTKAVNDASEAVSKETQKLQDLQQSLSGASDREQNFVSQKERAANTIAQENELLGKQQSELAALKVQQQSLVDAEQRDIQAKQQNAAAVEKQRGAVKYYEEEIVSLQARLSSAQAKIDRFYEVQAKARESISSRLHAPSDQFIGYNDYERGKSVYSKTEQDVRSLIKALSELDNADKKHGFGDELRRAYMNLTPSQDMANVFKRQQEEISSYIKTLQEAKKGTKGETRANLDNQIAAAKELLTIYKELGNAQNSLNKTVQKEGLRDGGNVGGIKRDIEETQKAYDIAKRKLDELTQSSQKSNAIRQESLNVAAKIQEKEREISETKGRIAAATKEQSEAEKNASQAAKEKANIQSQVANQEKQVAEAKKQLTTATQQHTDAETKSSRATKEKSMTLDQQASAINTVVQSEKKYTDEVLRQAAAIRSSKEWQEKGHVVIGDINYYDKERANVSKRDKQLLLSLEEQIVQAQQKETQEALVAAEANRQKAQAAKEAAQASKGVSAYDLGIDPNISAGRQRQIESTRRASKETEYLRQQVASLLEVEEREIKTANTTSSSYAQLAQYLKNLQSAYQRLGADRIAKGEGTDLANEIQRTQRAMQKLQQTMSRPVSLKDAMGLSEKTLDDIAYKMRQLASYRSGLNVDTQKKEILQVNDEYNRLKKRMDEVMQKNQQMMASNTALGRSWNYMKNRLAFYFTVGAGTSFVKNLIEVRSQYEMNERALGILINSAERGTQIFNELSQMALVSPYTLIELSTAAKQLTAYDVAAKDVVDTTRRLADMAAAVGIPIERLTYALGQIKAYGYLNARDARMFSNAGIPLVKQLAEHYTELEGKMVSTADVYDRIKKKAIDMTDVMQVINKMTDEGGKFFDFQAKMAGTLKVQLANLTLAWNNMLNDIGASEQGTISTGIGLLKELFLEWKNISKMITNLAIGFGIVKVAQLAYYGVVMGTNKAIALEAVLGNRLSKNLRSLASSMNAASMSSTALWVGIATFAAAAVVDILRGNEAMKEFNKTLRENAENTYNDLKKFSENYSGLRESLYKTENGKQTPVDINSEEAKKAWEVLREQIELSSHASDEYIGKLLSIENVSERLRQGFTMIESIQSVSAAIKELGDSSIKLERDWSEWWNLGLLPDGTIGNLQDAYMWLSKIEEKYGSVANAKKVAEASKTDEGFDNTLKEEAEEFVENYETELEKFRKDLQVTKQSIIDFIELKGWSGDTSKINEAFKTFTDNLILKNQLNPQQAYTLQLEMEEARSKAAKQALLQRINDERAAYKISHDESVRQALNADIERYNSWSETNGRSKVEWERFTKWLKEQHISETTAMFRNMDAEDIRSLNFQEGKHAEWVKRMVTQYAKEHKMSYDDAFKYLKNWVRSANQWSIFIPMTISTEDSKTVYKQLGEYDKAVDEADAQIARLTTRINELNAKKKKSKEETKELAEAEKELTQAQKDKADAEAKGGHGKKEKKDEKAANKAAKQAESELQKALKDELSTIDKVRSIYKDLTKEGMSHADAVERATRGWDETVNAINRVLQKNGLQKLDLSKFAGIENPRELVNMLQSQLNTLLKRGAKPAEIKELQTKVNTLEVDADKYDLTKITKGLNNELGKLKDEYELAVELDADPELGNAFADMMGINVESLPHTVKEYADRYSTYLNKYLKGKNSALQFTSDELRGLTRDDITAFREQVDAGSFNQEWFDAIKKAYDDIQGKRKKDIEDTEKWKNSLIEKYGNLQDKLTKIYKDSVQNQVNAVKTFGTEGQKSDIVRLQLRLEATDNPAELAEINTEIAKIVKDVTDKNPIALKLVTASGNQTKADASKAYWEDFKNSELYAMTFEDMANNSTRAIQLIMDKLEGLKDKVKEDPASMKALIKSLEDAQKELNARDPFGGVARSLRDMANASQEAKTAQEALWRAEVDVEQAQQEVDNAEDGTPEEQAAAQQKLADAVQRRAAAQVKLTQAENKGKKAQENLKSSLQGISNQLGNVQELFGVVSKLFRAGGDDETADAIDAISEGFSIMTTVIMGVVAAMIILQSTTPWLLAIAAALSVIVGLVSFLSGNSNKKITEQVEESERAVKRLELAYKNLEYAADGAFGAATAGAQQAIKANKELQLAELKRQLMLEQSRDSKDRDEDRIIEIRGQIIELEHEISNFTKDAVNGLLGISSHGDFFESMITDMIEAFKNGEDAMEVFEENWSKMIDNMLMKAIVSQVLGDWVKSLESGADKILEKFTKEQSKAVSDVTSHIAYLYSMDAGDISQWIYDNDREAFNEILSSLGQERIGDFESIYDRAEWFSNSWNTGLAQKIADAYKSMLNNRLGDMNSNLEKASLDATGELIDYYGQAGNEFKDEYLPQILDKIQENWNFGQDSEKQLSNLQQGIAGITEDTAGALEAITNGISQQCYLQSDLLTQIRDSVVGLDLDVSLGVQSQMLLQLQNSYQTQQAIQQILEGVLVPSGRAFAVELLS